MNLKNLVFYLSLKIYENVLCNIFKSIGIQSFVNRDQFIFDIWFCNCYYVDEIGGLFV